MIPENEAKLGLFHSSRRLLKTALNILENRLELFLVEWREERLRMVHAMLLVGAFVMFSFLALVMLSVTLVVAFWETARLTMLIALSATYSLAALGFLWRLIVRFKHWPAFQASLDEVKKDRACLDADH